MVYYHCHIEPIHAQVLREMAERVRDDGTDDFQDVDWCKVPPLKPGQKQNLLVEASSW